ncbi:nucleoporin subcomplex protein binding to Pom34-domain-containing protein [Podospora aff. communis PSN243]|uniref:Nucleoporin NUP188 n=1 Tax=Podospora aff. communis PSN243 TaxID=3040156 RepID=A0AAV9H8A7_9PEZI|nr:nucleoporin subcomplex protein binding to Pom34-domain-containing protein [Podospora aff. communis PSN243]
MASVTDRTYFPPLGECLNGKIAILSWKSVASALEHASGDLLASAAVAHFLKDAYVLQLLKAPSTAFEPPSAQSKADYETKTAAINVVPTPNDPYNINEIKSDAMWLSAAIKVNEVAALRIAVLEYLTRAQSHLTGPLSTQDAVNIQEAAGVSDAQASSILALLNVSAVADAEATQAAFETETSRRQRILATYLSERRSFLSAADSLITFLLHSTPASMGPDVDVLRKKIAILGFNFDEAGSMSITAFEELVPKYLEYLEGCVLRSGSNPEVNPKILTEALQVDWTRTALTEAIHSMSLSFQVIDLAGQAFASPDVVSQWFRLMGAFLFLEPLVGDADLIAELVWPIRSLASAISVKLINAERSILYLRQDIDLGEAEDPYLASSDILNQVHVIVTGAADAGLVTASPVMFAWSMVLHHMYLAYQDRAERRDLLQNQRAQDGFELENTPAAHGTGRRNSAGSIVSIEKSSYDLFLAQQHLERDLTVAEGLAMSATAHGQVYEFIGEISLRLGNGQFAAFRPAVGCRVRAVFLDLLKVTFPIVGFREEPVSALLSLLSAGQQYWDLRSDSSAAVTKEVTSLMLEDKTLMDTYLFQARCRYPLEFIPFASFSRILSTNLRSDNPTSEVIMNLLLKTPSLTLDWRPDWNEYELIFEDENTNSFKLLQDVDLFTPSRTSRRRFVQEERLVIPRGTIGRFISEEGRVAILDYEHSTLALLGKRLETTDPHETGLGLLATEEIAEGISLLATVLRTESLKAKTADAAIEAGTAVLKEVSRILPRTKDIITVICDILDGLIQEDLADLDGAKTAAMTSCLQFLHATLQVAPGRVWAYMTRCGLINGDARAGRLSRLTGNLDVFAERFEFLSTAIKFFSSLVDSAMTSAVQRRTGISSTSRSKSEENPWLGTSDKLLSRVAHSIAQTAIDVFENSVTWRFPSEVDRSVLVNDVVGIQHKLLSYTYSVGSKDSSNTLTGCLEPAARYIVESFVAASSSSLRFQPLLATLLVAFQIPDSTLFPRRAQIVSSRLLTVLDFSTALLRVANYLEQPSATIQVQLFKSASLVARLPAARRAFKVPSIILLSALVESAGKGAGEPPSLLGYLGPQISRSFIHIVAQLDRPFDHVPEVISMWKFFSTIMRNRQQWMANCLLTGKTPREALKGDAKSAKLSPDSVLATALGKLRAISTTPSEEIMAVLDFFTSVQNYWPWTVFALQKEEPFLADLRSYVHALKAPSVVSRADAQEAGYQARIAAYIAETFAMQLYHLRQMGQQDKFANEVVNDLDYFLRNAVQVSEYNASLHANFAKNFSKRYPGCSPEDFKRTVLMPRDLGTQYFYALDFAEAVLNFDSAWVGPKKNGFRLEMETANLNLSLVEAEVALFHAWEYLLLELSACLLPKNGTVAKQMLQVAEQCLESNQRAQPPEGIFVRLLHSRANLALTLLQRLAECSQLPKDINPPLSKIAAAIYSVEEPFTKENIAYFRTLLKILFVVLRGSRHSANSEGPRAAGDSSVAVTQQVLTILDRVVARAFRTLVTLVHEPESVTTPEDLALVTAVLQACLSVPGIEQCQVQILNIMSSFEVLQSATSLFSWADKLADKGDPIYGELALLFLLELSALPTIAEQLAIDGLLSHITTANLTGFMRRDNVSPFSDNTGAARCYGIWAKGVLPLLLNILRSLGATIAPEVAYVLNQFPNLLRASAERFEAPGISRTISREAQTVTLIAVAEINSLALLTRVLAVLRLNNQRDIPEIQWDAAAVLENVEFWLASRKVLRERLLPLGPRESDWRAMKASEGNGCENLLEEKVVVQLEAVRDVLSEDLE